MRITRKITALFISAAAASTIFVGTASAHDTGNWAKDEIARRESGGDYYAVNPSSGAFGKYQCMPSVHICPTDPAAQEAWADEYVYGRYGSWEAALYFHNANGWY